MPGRKRPTRIRPSDKVKVDFLIPIVQDSTKRPHLHTAYEEWNTLLFLKEIEKPTRGGWHEGSEGWDRAVEHSVHWWVAIPRRRLQTLLCLLRDEARRIFDQRWIIAWTGETVYELSAKVKVRGRT